MDSAGKHLLMHFSGDVILRTHMRMNGSWHIYRPGERWQRPFHDMRIIVATAAFEAIAFNVPVAEFTTAARLVTHDPVAALGPDLLSPTFDTAEALARLKARGAEPIIDALLNQRVMAGIGNVFKSEVLFVRRVHPFTPVDALDDAALAGIIDSARMLLRANVVESSAGGGGSIVTYRGMRTTTRRSDPSARLWVYGRAGEPCRRCGTAIAITKEGPDARLTYWCPQCQAAPARAPQP